MLSWAPLSLLYQFKRAANIYFLIISVLTFMPFSPKVINKMFINLVANVDDRYFYYGFIFYHAQRGF